MLKNAKVQPKIYFGLHMVEGVAEYQEPNEKPYRIFIGEQTLKNMDPSFQGRPVYVKHVDEVNLDKLQEEADGYVVRSFFNERDGKHWVEFIVVSDKGHEAIAKGWKLSNAYLPKALSNGGLWHGVEFSKEITQAEYEHLAIVPNPRYEESIIFTPEEFKNYNGEKEIELKRLANEKGDTSMLNLFKKTKVENTKEFSEMVVTLPQSKIEMSLSDVVSELDSIKNMHGYANEEHMVKVGNEEMTVKKLVAKHQAMCQELEDLKKEKEGEHGEKKNDEDANDEKLEEKKKNDDKEDEEDEKKENKKKKNEGEKSQEELAAEEVTASEAAKKAAEEAAVKAAEEKKKENFNNLKNAHLNNEQESRVDLSEDMVARGRKRYGSGN